MHDYSAGVVRTEWPKAMFKGDDSKNVQEADFAAAKADGWRLTQGEPDDTPVTRAELEQKARELGVKFDGRTTDKKLAALIDEAMK